MSDDDVEADSFGQRDVDDAFHSDADDTDLDDSKSGRLKTKRKRKNKYRMQSLTMTRSMSSRTRNRLSMSVFSEKDRKLLQLAVRLFVLLSNLLIMGVICVY